MDHVRIANTPKSGQHAPSPQGSVYPKPMTRLPTPAPFNPSQTSFTPALTSSTLSPNPASPSHYTLKPYLSLPSRLSHTILSLPLISLLLSLSSLLSANSAANARAQDAKAQIMATCKGVEEGVRFITEGGLARVMAEKVNEGVVVAVQGTLSGLRFILVQSLTIMEAVITFMIDTYRSLLMCTIEFAVRGSLALLIGAVQTISDGITNSLNAIRTNIQSDVSRANSIIAAAVTAINRVTSIASINLSIPQFDIPSLGALENVQIPTGFEDDLVRLNASLPTLDEFGGALNELVGKPFELMKVELNETFSGLIARVNITALPVPGNPTSNGTLNARAEPFDLCSNMDTSFIDDISRSLSRLAKLATALLVLAFFLLWLALIVWEWWTWKQMKVQASEVEELIEKEVREGREVDGLRLVQMVENPLVERYGGVVVNLAARKHKTKNNLRWFLAYITHPPALLLLAFGILTFLVMQIQLSAVNAIRERSSAQANDAITAQSQSLAAAINDAMLGQSKQYAQDVNAVIAGWQQDIDETIFGPWLNTTTVTLNTTLVDFYDKVEGVLDETFGGTFLAPSINTFAYCILGSKIDGLSTALTWIHENAKVTLPTLNENALLLSNQTMNDMATPISAAAAGDGTSNDAESQGVIGKMFDRYEAELRKQRNIAGIFIGVYGLVLLIGLAVFVWHTWLRKAFMKHMMQAGGKDDFDAPSGEQAWNAKPGADAQLSEKFQPREDTKMPLARGDAWVYSNQAHARSQESFFEDPEDEKPRFKGLKTLTLAEMLKNNHPPSRNKHNDNYDEPMLPLPAPQQSSAGFAGKVTSLVTRTLSGSNIKRSDSVRTPNSEKSWQNSSATPAATWAFQISSPQRRFAEQSKYPPVSKGAPSPLAKSNFAIGDHDDVDTPIAELLTQQRQASNPFATPFDDPVR